MKYNFDEIIERRGTNSIKYEDGLGDARFPADTIPMWIADMDFATPQPILDAMHERLDKRILGYSGIYDPNYKQAVTGWCRRRFGWEVDPETIITYPGICRAINSAVANLTASREGVILMTPAYHPFGDAIKTFGRTPVYTKLIDNDGYFTVDFQDLEAKAKNPRNTLLFLCSPQNPTGRVWTAMELARIGDICFRNNVFVFVDEIHADLVRCGVEHVPFMKLFPNEKRLIACNAPSKTFNMAGCQLSNIIIPDARIRESWESNIFALDPNPLSIDAAIAAYNRCEGWLEEVKGYLDNNFLFMRDFLCRYLPVAKLRIPEGTYLAWVDLRGFGLSDAELNRRISASGVYAEFAGDFVADAEGFMRLNIACPRAVLEEGLKRIAKALR